MEEIDYKRSIELLNRDADACLEIIESWKKNCAYLVSIGVMPPDQWGVPLVEKLVPYERYDVVYHCNPATGDKILHRYILKNGFELYSIGFSCKSRNASVLYSYVIANSVRDAKERFKRIYGDYMKIYSVQQCDEEIKRDVLNEYWKHPTSIL